LKKLFLIVLLVVVFTNVADAQCAMCRAVLENEDGGAAAKGINNGIIYLMIFPYLLIAGVGFFIYRMRKKARAEEKNLE